MSTHYLLAGPADSLAYAAAERLVDLLVARDLVQVTKIRKHPSVWPSVRESIKRVIGVTSASLGNAASPIVFTSTARYVGDEAVFAELAASAYGVSLDVDKTALEAIAQQNMAEAERELRQAQVLSRVTGRKALLLIDIQNDFCGGGSLSVPDGDAVVPIANRLRATVAWDLVVLTQDWHPRDHASFASNNPGSALFTEISLPDMGRQMMWPDHCVQGSRGAEFHPHLARADNDVVVRKGTHSRVDSYSGFGDGMGHTLEKTEMEEVLRHHGITDVFVCGLALDFCVAFTCKDAVKAGFNVFLIHDATRGIAPESMAREMSAMRDLGVNILERADDVPTKDVESSASAGILGGATASVGLAVVRETQQVPSVHVTA